jgi:hypothetical protein
MSKNQFASLEGGTNQEVGRKDYNWIQKCSALRESDGTFANSFAIDIGHEHKDGVDVDVQFDEGLEKAESKAKSKGQMLITTLIYNINNTPHMVGLY